MLDNPKEVQKAIEHLKPNPHLAPLIDQHPAPKFELATDPFHSLSRTIVFQQLSGKAASTIYGRLETLAGGQITPESLLPLTIDQMREAGVSRPKASYLKDLAARFHTGQVHGQQWPEMTNEEVKAEITSIKGLGDWCADMYLMFSLCRPDIWPTGDQGIRNAARLLTKQEEHLTKDELIAFGDPFRPYRTIAATYLWRAVDTKAIKDAE